MNRERSMNLADVPSSIAAIGAASPLRLVPGEAVATGDSGAPALGATVVVGRSDRTRATPAFAGLADALLPQYEFVRQMQREMRRADRLGSPLSAAIFHFKHVKPDGSHRNAHELLELLGQHKRQTDLLCHLHDGQIVVLLPDTDKQGAGVFLQKVIDRADGLPFSSLIQTYPNQLFDALIENTGDTLQFPAAFADDAALSPKRAYRLKRVLDLVGATIALLLLWPLILVTAVAVAVTSRGPIIYRQVRLGQGGVPFVFYKFRSMFDRVDDQLHREYVTNLIHSRGRDDGAHNPKTWSKLTSDPRITPVGRFIRRTSLDELPQIINVLKGDLSLVGPRPPIPYEATVYQSWHLRRILETKPGITGLWQTNAGVDTTFDGMVRMDLRYARDVSLMLDLKILMKTVAVVLRRTSA